MLQNLLRCGPLLAASFLALPAHAQSVELIARLDADQQGGSVVSSGIGNASGVVDTVANTFTFNLSFGGLTSAQTAGHIHGPAAPGANGPVAFNLGVGSVINTVWNYPQSAEADLLNGLYYFNIHTANFPGGEIRGQITPAPQPYCFCSVPADAPCGNTTGGGGCASSLGIGSSIVGIGLTSVTIDDLVISAIDLPGPQNGLFFMGTSPLGLPFGDGRRCVGGQVFRFPIQSFTAAANIGPGIVAQSQGLFGPAGHIGPGETWYFQFWYRDPGGPCGANFNLSNGLEVTFTP